MPNDPAAPGAAMVTCRTAPCLILRPAEVWHLGDFELMREIGRGGMGIVFEARQLSLNRKVALKVLHVAPGFSERIVKRFHREAEAAAKLHHSNIVPIYATGEQHGIHYYAMELIEGLSLEQVIGRLRQTQAGTEPLASEPAAPAGLSPGRSASTLSAKGPVFAFEPNEIMSSTGLSSEADYFDAVARMLAAVADALEHAHQNGVIHRDVKPGNLLLSPEGRLTINDFGLARMLEQQGMTLTGEFVGTPAYMSPEQISAGRAPLDHRTDIYSLGATLYELLTLRPPFQAERRDQVLAQIIHKDPVAPHKVNRKVPVDLETICLKAMEKDPDRRYQTAGQMAEDLRRYVNRFAILGRRSGPLARAAKRVRQRAGLTAALGALLVALFALGFLARQAQRAEQRQVALEKALVEALGGDPQVALLAIHDAEDKGVAPGQLNLLRGLLEHQCGNSPQALVHLEQAKKQLPDSMAVKALLAQVQQHNGRFDCFHRAATGLGGLRSPTTQDYLLLALALSGQDPDLALSALEKVQARLRQSQVGRLVNTRVVPRR